MRPKFVFKLNLVRCFIIFRGSANNPFYHCLDYTSRTLNDISSSMLQIIDANALTRTSNICITVPMPFYGISNLLKATGQTYMSFQQLIKGETALANLPQDTKFAIVITGIHRG